MEWLTRRALENPRAVLLLALFAAFFAAAGIPRVGTEVGYRVVRRGWAVRTPLLQTVSRMDMRLFMVEVSVSNAYSKGGIPLTLAAIANVKISSNPNLVRNAVERFLGMDPKQIAQVARQTLEGVLRELLAQAEAGRGLALDPPWAQFAQRVRHCLDLCATVADRTGRDRHELFEHVHAQFDQLARHAQLLRNRHATAGRLLPIAQRRIENI